MKKMAMKHSNKFGVQGSGSPNVLTLKRPPPRSLTRSDAALFAAWLATMAGDLDYFARILIDVWGTRYGKEAIPPWLLELAGPWEAPVEEARAEVIPPAQVGEREPRPRTSGPKTPPRAVPVAPIYIPRAAGQDGGPATRGPRPDPEPAGPAPVASGLAPSPIPAGGAAPKPAASRSRILINGKPASRSDIDRMAEDARKVLTGDGMAAPPPVVGEGAPDSVSSSEGSPDDLMDAEALLGGELVGDPEGSPV